MNASHSKKPPRYIIVLVLLITGFLCFKPRSPITIAYDPNIETCLPEFKYALLLHFPPTQISSGDLVFWVPQEALSYVKQEYVLKRVAGIPGDHLLIKSGLVRINGKQISNGMPLSPLYHRTPDEFDIDTTIPQNAYYLTGTHPRADDSRYWGFLYKEQIVGRAYEIY